MGYILVKPEVLKRKGYEFFETMPDGRAIAETNLLKVLGSVKDVEIVSTTRELETMIARQKKELSSVVTQPSDEQSQESLENGVSNTEKVE